MRPSLTISVAQPVCVPYDVAANAAAHAEMIHAHPRGVVVFPELSLTGYHFDADAVDPEDSALNPVVQACRDTGSLALVGTPVAGHGGRDHIAMFAIDEHGARVAYRKMWLGSEEMARFTAGSGPGIIEREGWRLGLAICKDTGVPQHAADTAAQGIDVYVAGTLEHDHDATTQAERARRIASSYNVWVAIASFAGATGEGYSVAAGRSAIWDPTGVLVAEASAKPGDAASATLVSSSN
jgi:predicted amidohydrolase